MRSHALAVLVVATGLCGCGGSAPEADSRIAAQAAAEATAAKERAAATREAERLAALWTYTDVPAGKGRQVSAAINSTNNVDTDGTGERSVMFVLRDHPEWDKSAYLILKAGDFNCYSGCTVKVTADGTAPTSMAARRPKTDEAIAMLINDAQAMRRIVAEARSISLEFPVKAGGRRTATFDVDGFDSAKMPVWEPGAK